jgi:hypothetical protein
MSGDYTPREIELIAIAKAEALAGQAEEIDSLDKKGRFVEITNLVRVNALAYYKLAEKYRAAEK